MDSNENIATKIQNLIDRFRGNYRNYTRSNSNYNETELRTDFINPLLIALGWDVNNTQGAPQHLREVVHEDIVEIERDSDEESIWKNPDYAIRVAGERKFFIETKKPSVDIENLKAPAFQIRRYGWNARLPISILTNFDKFIIYDCRYRPDPNDEAHVARIGIYKSEEFIQNLEELRIFSREAVYSGEFDEKFKPEKLEVKGEPFDEYFLNQIERWRLALANNLHNKNADLGQEEINYLVQLLINRIIFLRICEDRNIEKYENLKKAKTYEELRTLFLAADKRYNSGLFNFGADQLANIVKIQDEVIVGIFQELYYPQSPYAFSVVEPSLLGEIYERFISRQTQISDTGEIIIVEKPEVVESKGVVPTPKYIVDEMVDSTLSQLCNLKSPEEITNLKVVDMACGSGIFLLTSFEYLLNYCREWYIENGAQNFPGKIYEGTNNQYFLTLEEKHRILTNSIFGVDIDQQAVEVTKLSLLLKVIENESAASIDSLLATLGKRGLPNIDSNIVCGNSLVDNTYYEFDRTAISDEEKIAKINPLVWEDAFPEIINNQGFDAVIENPPYIRIQNMVKYSPNEVEYYKNRFSGYLTSRTDNFDKYSLFIERGLSLLNENGKLCLIVPNKFFTTRYGTALRKVVSTGKHLERVVHFGVQQVFKGRTTYTCILSLNKNETPEFTVDHVSNLTEWRYKKASSNQTFAADFIDDKPWVFVSPEAQSVFSKIEKEDVSFLKDVTDIFVGLQTSNDSIYIRQPIREDNSTVTFIDMDKREQSVEKAILRPCFLDVSFNGYDTPQPNSYIIFPYRIEEVPVKNRLVKRAILFSPDHMEQNFPLCWNYLNLYKDVLKKRSIQGYTEDTWYRFGRSQSLTKFDGEEKLIWHVMSLEPRYAYDTSNACFTGGGNGPYYGLKLKENMELSLYFIQAILHHPVIEAWVRARASKFQQDYGSHGKQFIANIPLPILDFNNNNFKLSYDKIVQLVSELISLKQRLVSVAVPQRRAFLERQIKTLRSLIQKEVSLIYGIDREDIQAIAYLLAISPAT